MVSESIYVNIKKTKNIQNICEAILQQESCCWTHRQQKRSTAKGYFEKYKWNMYSFLHFVHKLFWNFAWMSAAAFFVNQLSRNWILKCKANGTEKPSFFASQMQEIVCNGFIFLTKSPYFFRVLISILFRTYAPAFWSTVSFDIFFPALYYRFEPFTFENLIPWLLSI